jgi:2'-5' RNA ligase
MLRAFLSIDLPASLQPLLSQVQNTLKKSGADVRWVPVGNIHLTLKFFGNIPEAAVDTISAAAHQVASRLAPFTLQITSLGAFPSIHSPRVVWLGALEATNTLAQLYRGLEEAFHAIGYPLEDRAFHPHLTLGRLRSNTGRAQLSQLLAEHSPPAFPAVPVNALTLFRSTLTPQGSIYSPLKAIPLGGG